MLAHNSNSGRSGNRIEMEVVVFMMALLQEHPCEAYSKIFRRSDSTSASWSLEQRFLTFFEHDSLWQSNEACRFLPRIMLSFSVHNIKHIGLYNLLRLKGLEKLEEEETGGKLRVKDSSSDIKNQKDIQVQFSSKETVDICVWRSGENSRLET